MYRTVLLILLIFLLVTSLYSKTLGYYVLNEIRILGPIYGEDRLHYSRITSLLFDSPMTTTPDLKLIPLLFQEPGARQLDTEGRHIYKLKVRNNIRWHDDRELTAEDILFTYECIKHPRTESSNAKNKIEGILDMKQSGKYDLEVYFNTPYYGNLGFLTFNILPKYHFPGGAPLDKSDFFFTSRPIGTGRYKIKFEFNARQVFLERNDKYFYKEYFPENIKEVTIIARDDLSVAAQLFVSESSINLFPDVPFDIASDFQRLPHVNVIEYTEYSWQFIAFNLRKTKMQDPIIRKAINLAMDIEEFNLDIYRGQARCITGPFPANHDAYNHAYIREFGIEEAHNLLTSNGFIAPTLGGIREKMGTKLSFKLSYERSGDEQREQLITKFTEAMRIIGIEIISEPLDAARYDTKIREERDFEMVLYEFFFGTDPDITPMFHSTYDRKRGFNVCGLRDNEIDRMLEEVRVKATVADINIIYRQLHSTIAEKNVGVFLWQTPKYVAYDPIAFPNLSTENIDPIDLFRFIHKW